MIANNMFLSGSYRTSFFSHWSERPVKSGTALAGVQWSSSKPFSDNGCHPQSFVESLMRLHPHYLIGAVRPILLSLLF